MSERFPIAFGRYQLTERLAMGGMAELFIAQASGAHGFEKKLVIKRILPHLAGDSHFTQMFISEAKLTARLAHPKIAQTYELGQFEERLYIAMEYVDGLDVLAMLRECAHRSARLPAEASIFIAMEMLDALDFAHKQTDDENRLLGIVHRDVSPSNILVSRRGNVKLVDFGIAHAIESEHRTRAGTLKGKYGYMSPEQVVGDKVSARSDIFSAGIVLAEMLMGRRLFAAPNELDVLLMVRDVNLSRLDKLGRDIHPRLLAVLRRALKKDAAERYAEASEFRDALDEWMFENRFRVTPRHIGELVESLYEAATERRRKQLEAEEVQETEGPLAVMSTGNAAVGSAPRPPERDGIPLGIEIEESARVEIETAIEGIAIDDAELSLDEDEVELDAERSIDIPIHEESLDEPESDLGITEVITESKIIVDAVPSSGEIELSQRYPSISAAVASLSPPGPDPASRDFDDSDVSGVSGADASPVSRRIVERPPSMEQLKKSTKPKAPEMSEISNTPSTAGDLSITAPIQVLFHLASTQATGLLAVSIGGIKKEIYFRDGVPEYVSSNVAGELFGAYLVSQEAISEAELDMALAMMPHYGGKLGDTLVGLGLMKPLDVFRHLTRQVRRKIVDVCTWEKGHYAWYSDRENPREAFPLDLDPFEVVGAGAMALPRDLITRWKDRVAQQRPKAVKGGSAFGPESFRAGGRVRDVYDRLDGRRTVAELAARYTDEEKRLEFLRALYLLVNTGLARADAG